MHAIAPRFDTSNYVAGERRVRILSGCYISLRCGMRVALRTNATGAERRPRVTSVAAAGPLLAKERSGIRLEDTDLDHHARSVRMYVADTDFLTASSGAVQHPRAARSHGGDAITASGPSLPAWGPPWNPNSALTRWGEMPRRNAERSRRIANNWAGPGRGSRHDSRTRTERQAQHDRREDTRQGHNYDLRVLSRTRPRGEAC